MQFVVIGTPGERHVELFQQALHMSELPAADIVSYPDILSGRVNLAQIVRKHAGVRIESPGRDFEIEKLLLTAGAVDAMAESFDHMSVQAIAALPFDKGRIWYPRQWYLGLCHVLRLIGLQLAECPPHTLMNAAQDIAFMFDKSVCHSLLSSHSIPVPRGLSSIRNFDDLIDTMRRERCFRVFVKLAHGSSASGAVAYEWNGDRHRAITTVEVFNDGSQTKLYNSRRIRTIYDLSGIRSLIDALCRHNVHVEQWIPKAGHHNKVFDLRVMVIAGEVRHTVVRLSNSPMTNLHLLNERGGIDILQDQMPASAWDAAQETCRQAAALFPNSLYTGIDLMFEPSYRRHYILEMNAFGDLLPGLLHREQSTYEAEIDAMLEQARC